MLFTFAFIIAIFGTAFAVPLENIKHLEGGTLNHLAVEHMEMAAAIAIKLKPFRN